jgi:hypothetical protein
VETWESLLMALGAALTLAIWSYLLGDNPLYRLALHIFVGASVAYIFVVTFRTVILPVLSSSDTLDPDIRLFSLVGVLFGGLLLMQGVRRPTWLRSLSRIPVAILLGVGVGVALSGAILGTLTPQLEAAANPTVPGALEPLGQLVAVVGTITGLMAFGFTGQRPARRLLGRLMDRGSRVGRWFLLIGFGAVYGGVLAASLAFFADRVQYLIDVLGKMNGG